jgi:hypothetical protein
MTSTRVPEAHGKQDGRVWHRNFFVLPSVTVITMNTSRFLLVALLALAPWVSRGAPKTTVVDPRMQVNFFEPEKFTDVKMTEMADDRDRDDLLARIREYLVGQAKYYIPQGQTLEITFTDIDMAGEFEPWRGPQWNDVRVVKDIYPPRMAFSFRLTDAEGNVLKQGRRELRDMGFLLKLSIDRNDSLRHEKAMLDDWLRNEIGRVRKS